MNASERLPIAFAKVKPRNNSENILNEIRQIAYYFYQKNVLKRLQ